MSFEISHFPMNFFSSFFIGFNTHFFLNQHHSNCILNKECVNIHINNTLSFQSEVLNRELI